MSSLRQTNLFAGEDFQLVYRTFKDVKFTAYDYDSIKETLISNIRNYYPEEFNDFVSNSEFIALIDLISFLSSSISFRNDLNSRQNILPLADRKESIINLARLISYQPKRAIPASGLFKIKSIRTTEPVTDNEGNNLINIPIFWNDINNESWYDQFIQVVNSVVNSSNTFSRPSKSGRIAGVQTDLYQLNNVLGLEVSYKQSLMINGTSVPIEIVNPDFEDGLSLFERKPDPQEALNLIYQNDQLGFASANTGFFFYFKQGILSKIDNLIENPSVNLVLDIDQQNINNEDVYVQEINDNGDVLTHWTKVPSVNGNNVIYNSLELDDRNIVEVITKSGNAIQLKFSDGTFGNVPSGILRTWVRTSLDQNIIIRPKDAKGLTLSIPYIGKDSQEYIATFTYDLEYVVSNSSTSETAEQIKERAPQSFYSQNRMVNNQDYNVFPLSTSNQILKLKSTNRMYAGHSRFIDINDPTGFHKDLVVLGQDGAIYKDYSNSMTTAKVSTELQGNIPLSEYIINSMQSLMSNTKSIDTMFYTDLIQQMIAQGGSSVFDLPNNVFWKTLPDVYKSHSGFFANNVDLVVPLDSPAYEYVKPGAILNINNESNVGVRSVLNFGIPYNESFSSVGPVQLSRAIDDGDRIVSAIPPLRKIINDLEKVFIESRITSLESFGLGYIVETDEWYIIENPVINSVFSYINSPSVLNVNSWLIYLRYVPQEGNNAAFYEITLRGTKIVFESLKSVEFFWDNKSSYDSASGKVLKDTISVVSSVNNDASGTPLESDIVWEISGKIIQPDGYTETKKIEIVPVDDDNDGISDYPLSFYQLVNNSDVIVFSKEIDQFGYESEVISQFEFNNLFEFDGISYDTSYQEITYDIFPGSTSSGLLKINNITLTSSHIMNHYTQIDNFATLLGDLVQNLGPSRIQYLQDINTQLSRAIFRNINTVINGSSKFQNLVVSFNDVGFSVQKVNNTNFLERNGIASYQNVPSNKNQLIFKWQHHSSLNSRIDPAISNIIDITILTKGYYHDVLIWKNSKRNVNPPMPPSSDSLYVQFAGLDQFKMISDQLIYKSGKFKFLFGNAAENELKASFKVIKMANSNISDNEIKTKMITAIEEYFAVDNWQFGETFYYTELSSYIHSQLLNMISSVVIVPLYQSSQFGDLFEVTAQSNEIFMSTATVDNIEIVSSYTESNLRM